MATFVETYCAVVAPMDCDHLGHMNVQHYFAAVSDGMFSMMARLGPVSYTHLTLPTIYSV